MDVAVIVAPDDYSRVADDWKREKRKRIASRRTILRSSGRTFGVVTRRCDPSSDLCAAQMVSQLPLFLLLFSLPTAAVAATHDGTRPASRSITIPISTSI